MAFDARDIELTRRALDLAAAGVGRVSPNPLVGCVVTAPDGTIAGEGSYIYDEVVHAEVIALEQAGNRAAGGTAYVSLEPHCHHNRTAPCTDALINAGIKRVVCPMEDPNPLVSGRGFTALRKAGIEVLVGCLADEAVRQNEKFICWHQKGRPFVQLKLALSLDGRISSGSGISAPLSSEDGLKRVHELRHEYDAILIGSNTADIDNPRLTDRSGLPRRRPLTRVVLDDQLRLSPDSELARTSADIPTIVFTRSTENERRNALTDKGIELVSSGSRDLGSVLSELKARDLQSVLVEGGSEVAGSFVDARLVDKFTFLFAPIIIGGRDAPPAISGAGTDTAASAFRLKTPIVSYHGRDLEVTAYPSD